MRSEEEIKEEKAELLSLIIEKYNNKINPDFGRDDDTDEIDGKIYALDYVLGGRRDI
ncbi:MAG: hypothetical protein M3270_01820 [Thermoproteota archaeon]|nr:hypothetical protein [Thermoproteota archaeon]